MAKSEASIEVAITIAFTILMPAASVSSLLVGLVIGVGLTIVMAVIPAITAITTSMIGACESWAGNYVSQSPVAQEWKNWLGAVSYWEAGPSDEFAATVLAVSRNNPLDTLAGAFAFAIVSLAMDFSAENGGGLVASVSATVTAGLSLVLSLKADSAAVDNVPQLKAMDNAVTVADALSLGWDANELKICN